MFRKCNPMASLTASAVFGLNCLMSALYGWLHGTPSIGSRERVTDFRHSRCFFPQTSGTGRSSILSGPKLNWAGCVSQVQTEKQNKLAEKERQTEDNKHFQSQQQQQQRNSLQIHRRLFRRNWAEHSQILLQFRWKMISRRPCRAPTEATTPTGSPLPD